MIVGAVVDSRNMFHQVGDMCGVRAVPTVDGVRRALSRYGLDVRYVHVGLALPRQRDAQALSRSAADNTKLRSDVLAAGGSVLLGELHRKPDGSVEEKMVDVAMAVRVTQYIEEIRSGSASVGGVVVLTQDSDLRPAYEHAIRCGVPVIGAASGGVQYRQHPYLLLGPHAMAEMCPSLGLRTGHEIREAVCTALDSCSKLTWEVVQGTREVHLLHRATSMVGVPAAGLRLPPPGTSVDLYPIDVTWNEHLLGSFPVLVLDTTPVQAPPWTQAKVKYRRAPQSIEVVIAGQKSQVMKAPYPLGGVAAGDTVLIHTTHQRVIGPLRIGVRPFDIDTPTAVRVITPLPKGGALVVDRNGVRGLLTTHQQVKAGQSLPVIQVDLRDKGPIWAAIGTPLPT